MGNKGKRSNVRWIRFSLLLLYLVSLLSTTAMAASPPKTQDVWFTHFARQDYRNQNGNFGGFEVESPETVAVGTPVSLRLFYQADPNQGAVPFHAEVTWGSGFRAGTYSIQLTADPFAFSTSDTRVFHAERPVFSGGSYVSPTTGRLDLFEMFEVASLSDLWIKFRVVDENGVVLEDRSCDWTGRTVEGTDAYTVTPNAGEINLVMYVGATKDDETVPEEEVDQAKLMMAEPEKAVAFTLSASGGITLRTASPQTLTFADYDPERAAAEAAGYNLYVASYVRNGAAVLGDEPGTLTMRSSILGSPYLTTHVWQHAYMDAYMNYPDTSIVRTLPVTAPSGNTTAGSASDAATPDETAESGASDSQSELEPVLPLPVPLSMPQAAAVGGTGLGAVGLLGILAAFHAKDYAALKPVLRQLSELAGATGLLSAQGMAAPAAETAASAEAAASGVAKAASRKFLPFLYLRFRKHTFLLRRETGAAEEGVLIRKVRLPFRSDTTIRLDVSADLEKLDDGIRPEELRIRHPRRAMRGKRNLEIVYIDGGKERKRDRFPDERSFEPVTLIRRIQASERSSAS